MQEREYQDDVRVVFFFHLSRTAAVLRGLSLLSFFFFSSEPNNFCHRVALSAFISAWRSVRVDLFPSSWPIFFLSVPFARRQNRHGCGSLSISLCLAGVDSSNLIRRWRRIRQRYSVVRRSSRPPLIPLSFFSARRCAALFLQPHRSRSGGGVRGWRLRGGGGGIRPIQVNDPAVLSPLILGFSTLGDGTVLRRGEYIVLAFFFSFCLDSLFFFFLDFPL